MTSESRFGENRRDFERFVKQAEIYLLVPPHISKFLIVDTRISSESEQLVKVTDFDELLKDQELVIFKNAVSNNRKLDLPLSQLLKKTIELINNVRPELGQVDLSKVFRYIGPFEDFAQLPNGRLTFNAILTKVDSDRITGAVVTLVNLERRDSQKNLISGINVAGIQTLWQRPK